MRFTKGIIAQTVLQQGASGYPFHFNKLILLYAIDEIIGFLMVSQEVRGSVDVPESDVVQTCRRVSPTFLAILIL